MKAEHQLETILQAFYISSIEANKLVTLPTTLWHMLLTTSIRSPQPCTFVAHAADNLHKITTTSNKVVIVTLFFPYG